jgi:hypothetical protein
MRFYRSYRPSSILPRHQRAITILAACVLAAGCDSPPTGETENGSLAGNQRPNLQAKNNEPPAAAAGGHNQGKKLRVPAGGKIPPLPTAKQVVSIWLQVSPPWSGEPKCTLLITSQPNVANFLGHLERIDWAQPGVPLEQVQLIAPDITLTVREDSGVLREYAFYWEGSSFVDGVTNRLLETDVTGLRMMVTDAVTYELALLQASVTPRLDASSKEALEQSFARMMAPLTTQQQDDLQQLLLWHENPYTNPLFDGALSDNAWLELPRHEKYVPLQGKSLSEMLAYFRDTIPGFRDSERDQSLEVRP